MSDFPKVDDPVVAVILDRFTRFEELAVDRLEKLDNRLTKIEDTHFSIANKAKGGYLVLLGLGTAASYFMGFFDQILRIFTKAH